MMVTIEGTHQEVLVDSITNILTLLIQISGIMGTSREDQHSPMLDLTTDTISSTLHPYTHPHLHLIVLFQRHLASLLLQIAENQSRTIEAMKASQEAQSEAYKEMSRTNKMRDDDMLFNSIEVYDGSNPTKFEKWIDSIDQATCITGRDLRKELLKKSDSVIRNSLTMIDATWSDDDTIAKLCQDFSSLSTMSRAREELKCLSETRRTNHCIHLQIWSYAFCLHRDYVRGGKPPICYYWVHFSIGTSAQQGCSKKIHRH